MKHSIDISFPDSKISETFLKFAEPLLCNEDDPRTPQEAEQALSIAFVVWNAIVYDTVHGNTEGVTRLRKQVTGAGPVSALIEELIARKQSQFGHDRRLVGKYEVVENDGEWRLRVEARSPLEKT